MIRKHLRVGRLIFAILLLSAFSIGVFYVVKTYVIKEKDTPVELDKNKKVIKNTSILAAGGVIVDNKIYGNALTDNKNNYDFSFMFKDLNVDKKEIMIYSQKSIIGGKELKISGSPYYNSPIEIGDTMVSLGFNTISLANYNAYDKGEIGITNSNAYWDSKEVIYSGTNTNEKNIVINKNDDLKYVFISYTMENIKLPSDKEYLINIYDEEVVKNDIDQIKDKVDLIVVSIDWGSNTGETITETQISVVNYLESIGVDIIVGNGDYIQPIEIINDTLVIYSLGNLLSYQTNKDKSTSAMISFDVEISISENKKEVRYNNIYSDLILVTKDEVQNYKVVSYSQLDSETHSQLYEKYSLVLKDKYQKITIVGLGD